jgi:RNA polymerase sigma factor (sigma-70 family)
VVQLPPFDRLVDDHWRDVARLAHALAGPVDGDDVAQQAWTQALAAYPRLTSTSHLKAWLMTITSRCAMDVHRARARRPTPVAEVADVADVAVVAGPASNRATAPADELALSWDAAVWDAVRALPQRQRTAVALRYVSDLDHAAVAQTLGTTPAATRRLVSDGLATLRAQLSDGSGHEEGECDE